MGTYAVSVQWWYARQGMAAWCGAKALEEKEGDFGGDSRVSGERVPYKDRARQDGKKPKRYLA